jgi:hypothetical protein
MNQKYHFQKLVGDLYGIVFEKNETEDEEAKQDAEDAEESKDRALEDANRSLL